jgi:hypothetical protein
MVSQEEYLEDLYGLLSDNEEGKGLRMRTAESPPDWTSS